MNSFLPTARRLPFLIHQSARTCLCSAIFSASFAAAQEEVGVVLDISPDIFIPPPLVKKVPATEIEACTVLKSPTHRLTVLRGVASTLLDIPVPSVAKTARLEPKVAPSYVISIDATIYDHSISHVRWKKRKDLRNIRSLVRLGLDPFVSSHTNPN
jgi:hypothetical protein